MAVTQRRRFSDPGARKGYDPAEVKRLYLVELFSVREVAEQLAIGVATVVYALESLGVARRSKDEAESWLRYRREVDKEQRRRNVCAWPSCKQQTFGKSNLCVYHRKRAVGLIE